MLPSQHLQSYGKVYSDNVHVVLFIAMLLIRDAFKVRCGRCVEVCKCSFKICLLNITYFKVRILNWNVLVILVTLKKVFRAQSAGSSVGERLLPN